MAAAPGARKEAEQTHTVMQQLGILWQPSQRALGCTNGQEPCLAKSGAHRLHPQPSHAHL